MWEKEKKAECERCSFCVVEDCTSSRYTLAHTGGGAGRSSRSKNASIMACDGNRSPRDFSKGLLVS